MYYLSYSLTWYIATIQAETHTLHFIAISPNRNHTVVDLAADIILLLAQWIRCFEFLILNQKYTPSSARYCIYHYYTQCIYVHKFAWKKLVQNPFFVVQLYIILSIVCTVYIILYSCFLLHNASNASVHCIIWNVYKYFRVIQNINKSFLAVGNNPCVVLIFPKSATCLIPMFIYRMNSRTS